MLIKKKKAFSLAGSPNIAFDQVEIFQRRKKGIVASNFYSINEVKSLSKEKKNYNHNWYKKNNLQKKEYPRIKIW